MRIRDISRRLGPATAVWPGDRPVSLEWTQRLRDGAAANVAAVSLSAHAGTHLDGPLHVRDDAAPVGAQPLEPLIGPARVVDVRGRAVLEEGLFEEAALLGAQRVLFRTLEAPDPYALPDRFAAIAPGLARRLVAAGVVLVGTDAPSVDPPESEALEAHGILLGAGVAVVEGLALEGVVPGDCTLIVLPLRLEEADSSPARAVLVEEWSE